MMLSLILATEQEGKEMKVTITHSTKTTGMITKTTYFEVAVAVQFSPQERSTVETHKLSEVNVLDRDPPANSNVRDDTDRSIFNLRISQLLRGPDTYACATPLQAKNYDAELREAMPRLKAYLDANATPLSGTDTFEL
jgi:hypothetical protein